MKIYLKNLKIFNMLFKINNNLKINYKSLLFKIFLLIFILSLFIYPLYKIYAQEGTSDNYDEIYSIEEIIQKLNEISKTKLLISFFSNYRLNYISLNENDQIPENIRNLSYFIFNVKFFYNFSTFSYLFIDFNLSNSSNIINLNNFINESTITRIYVNNMFYKFDFSKLFNINFLNFSMSAGFLFSNFSLVEPFYENYYHGLPFLFIKGGFANLNLAISNLGVNFYLIDRDHFYPNIYADFLDFLKMNVGFLISMKNSYPLIFSIQLLADFNFFKAYAFLFSYEFNNSRTFEHSIKLIGNFNLNLFNINFNFKISLFHEHLSIKSPISSDSTLNLCAYKLPYSQFERGGVELMVSFYIFKIYIAPVSAKFINNLNNYFYLDYLFEINIYPLFISYSSNLPIIDPNSLNGSFIRVGIKTSF